VNFIIRTGSSPQAYQQTTKTTPKRVFLLIWKCGVFLYKKIYFFIFYSKLWQRYEKN